MSYKNKIDGYECIKVWRDLVSKGEKPSCAKIAQLLPTSESTGEPFTRQAIRVAMINTPGGKELLMSAGLDHWKGRRPRVARGKFRRFCMKNEMDIYSDVEGIEAYRSLDEVTNQICYGFVPSEALLRCAEWVVRIDGTLRRLSIVTKDTGAWTKNGK